MSDPTEVHDVIIVGAGLTGLVAAERLRAAGRRVIVIERGPCPGGRMRSAWAGGSACFDTGPPSFLAQDPAFQQEVAGWEAAGVVAHWHPALRAISPDQATDAEPGSSGGDRIVGVPTMASLPDHLARDLDVRYEVTVETIEPDGAGWTLRSASPPGTPSTPMLQASEVLVTTPAPLARGLLGEHAPAELAHVQMLPCWVVMAVLDRPLLSCDAAWVNGGRLCWVAGEASKSGRPQSHAWTLLASPAYSSGKRDAQTKDVIDDLLSAARQLPGVSAFETEWTGAHFWTFSQTMPGTRVGVLRAPGLTVAGDWSYGGGVEAAWRAGVDAAAGLTC